MNIRNLIINIILACTALTLSAQSSDNLSGMPGYVNPEGNKTCFDYMGPVEFQPRYTFVSSYTGSTAPIGWTGGLINPSARRLYGFSIPLVGDLNGDGYPEIVAMGIADNTTALTAVSTYIYIYNGQTGKELNRFQLPVTWNNRASGYHGSPSQLALADVDRDGTKEIIVATGRGNTTATNNSHGKRLIAYSVDKSTFALTEKWISTERYDEPITTTSYDFYKAIPQVVDLDGDGTPEVVVYNKIYNAVNGNLLTTLENLGTTATSAFVGRDANASYYDGQINFNYVYDMDLDGVYDIVAGGKVYKLTKISDGTFGYSVIQMPGVLDGRTGVADINGDGIPDVVTVTRRSTSSSSGTIDITVWNPGFLKLDTNGDVVADPTGTPHIIAQYNSFPLSASSTGNNSYVYIGDIDGRETTYNGKTYRLPEIAILGGTLNYGTLGTNNVYPGVTGFPTTGNGSSGIQGVIAAVTFDPTSSALKLSFTLEHNDSSVNTGFTMFDFDNDGMQEICYRDEETLRIIKASKPYVTLGSNDPSVTLFNYTCRSYTGFEYPVIADIDNDASAEMVVMGRNQTGNHDYSFLYSIGSAGDKFAPALKVWNQFMYDPFKINEDLTTPIGKAPNRLDKEYSFTKIIRNEAGGIEKRIENYNPFNGTLSQMSKFQLHNGEFEPIVFLTEAYIVKVGESQNDTKKPKLVLENGKHYIKIWIGNKGTAKTDISPTTPIAIYKNEISKTTFFKKVSLENVGRLSAIKAGEEVELMIEVDDPYDFYILRLADDSKYDTSNKVTEWKWGINDPGIQDDVFCIGSASRAYRDCNWADQEIKVAKFALTDDAYTIQEFKIVLDAKILNNDILPDNFVGGFDGSNPLIKIKTQPQAGVVTATGEINMTNSTNTISVKYQHTGSATLADGIDKFVYEVTYFDTNTNKNIIQTATVYIYILQNEGGGFTACAGDTYTIRPKKLPQGTVFYWYEQDGTQIGNDPLDERVINNISGATSFKIKPVVPASNTTYGRIDFPIGDITAQAATVGTTLEWTGAVNTVWQNPLNWKEKGTGLTVYSPIGCLNVEIPKVATTYPSLSQVSAVNNVSFLDRSMLKNVHLLQCASVSWAFNAKSAETNKWLSITAPLTNMYSGDYILLDTGGKEIFNSAYMMFFEETDPDTGISADEGTMTRPFAKIGVPVSPINPFFLYIDANYFQSLNTKYNFPTGKTAFTYRKNNVIGAPDRQEQSTENIVRAVDNKEQFALFDETGFNKTDGSFTISYQNGDILYVANPYPSMLNIEAFVLANSGVLAPVYKIWDGDGTGDFMEIKYSSNNAPALAVKADAVFDNAVANGTTKVAPFQGFFVKLKSGVNAPVELKFQQSQTSVEAIDYTY